MPIKWVQGGFRLVAFRDAEINTPNVYINEVWRPVRALDAVLGGRRKWIAQVDRLHDFADRLDWPSGLPFPMPDTLALFSDPDNRWHSLFVRTDKSGLRPKSISICTARLRLYALVCGLHRAEGTFPEESRP